MAQTKEQTYYKAVRQAATAVSSTASRKEKLNTIVRAVSRCLNAGAAVLLLDTTGTQLIHTVAWKLPPAYVRKGLLDASQSLGEIAAGTPVLVDDLTREKHIQHPELALRAGIIAILGVPIVSGRPLGTLRVYFKEATALTAQEFSFVKTMANLAAAALCGAPAAQEGEAAPAAPPLPAARAPVTFANHSEEEFARILDFYGVDWIYEPRSFDLHPAQPETEMFTPDFYLPALHQYIELTTMKQSLVTQKNRKLRKLRELYPGVKISLLYKNDYDRLLAKYGVGPLAQSRAHGLRRVLFSATDIERRVAELAAQISEDYAGKRPILVGVQRGFLCFMADLMRQITVPLDLDFMAISYYRGGPEGVRVTKDIDLDVSGRHVILIEDIVDTGITLNYVLQYLHAKSPASLAVCVLLDRRVRRLVSARLDYVGFEVPDEFVVGYGLDYHEEYRNLPFIAVPEIAEFPAVAASRHSAE